MSTRPQHPAYEDDERFADWVDDCMSVRDRERFEAELRVNPQLREAAERYRRTVESVRTALRAPGPRIDVADAVLARLGAPNASASAPATTVPTLRVRPLLFSVVAAAAVVVVLALLNGLEPATGRTQVADAPPAPAAGAAPAATAPVGDPGDDPAGRAAMPRLDELLEAGRAGDLERAGGIAAAKPGTEEADAGSDRRTLQQALRERGEAKEHDDATPQPEAPARPGAPTRVAEAERGAGSRQFGQAPGAVAEPQTAPSDQPDGKRKVGRAAVPDEVRDAKKEAKGDASPEMTKRAAPGDSTELKQEQVPTPDGAAGSAATIPGERAAPVVMLPLVVLAPRADGRTPEAKPQAPAGPATKGPATPPPPRGGARPSPSDPSASRTEPDKDRGRARGAPATNAPAKSVGSLATLLAERGDAGPGADAGARSLRTQGAAVELRRIAVEPAAVQALGAEAERLLHGTAWLVEGDEPVVTAFLKELADAARRDDFTLGHGEVPAEVVQALLPATPVVTGADEFSLGSTGRANGSSDGRAPQRRRVVVLLRAAPAPAGSAEPPPPAQPRDTGR